MLNRELFTKNMVAMGEMFNKTFSKELLRMYYMVIGKMTDEQFLQAVEIVMETHQYNTLPKPADFINAIKPDDEAKVIIAWQKIENAMARVGAYETVIFDDPLIHGFIQGYEGEWPGLCATANDTLVWVRKEFERYYRAIKPENITCKPLIGISEGENIKSGQEYKDEPIYIGDGHVGQMLIETGRKQEQILKKLEG